MQTFTFQPIGWIRSCFPEKFGIPRQPNIVSEARAVLTLAPGFQHKEAFRALDGFSHIWLIFVFHACYRHEWKPTVRPPRLGGNQRVGVFASRSGFRPNAIGQSAVQLLGMESGAEGPRLHLGGVDLLDGTPVLDIKPYLPYADSIPGAAAGYACQAPPHKFEVAFTEEAENACRSLNPEDYPDLRRLICGLLAQDPRPGYRTVHDGRKLFGMRLWDLNIRFRVEAMRILVSSIKPIGQGEIPNDNSAPMLVSAPQGRPHL